MLHPESGILSDKQFIRLSRTDFEAVLTLREWLRRQLFLSESDRRPTMSTEQSLVILRIMVLNLKKKIGADPDPFFSPLGLQGEGVFGNL
jgi:hypothetical protein